MVRYRSTYINVIKVDTQIAMLIAVSVPPKECPRTKCVAIDFISIFFYIFF